MPRHHWLLVTYVLLIISPNLALLQYAPADAQVSSLPIAVGLGSVLVILSLCSRVAVGVLVLLPVATLAPLELLYIADFERPSDVHLLGILSETAAEEASAFLGGLGYQVIGLVLMALLFSLATVRTILKEDWRWSRRSRLWVLVPGILAACLFAGLDDPLASAEAASPQVPDLNSGIVKDGASSLASLFLTDSYPVGLPLRVMAFVEQREALQRVVKALDGFRFDAEQAPSPEERQIHVLVIGETGRPDRWQLNGYSRPTTPRLAATSDVVSFTDVTSAWAWTRMSVPVILTRKPDSDGRIFFPEKSLISAYREVGFKTYWFSTQSPLGMHDSPIAVHANEADELRYLNPSDYRGKGVYDGALLLPLQRVLDSGEKKQLIVLHTLGGHYNYANRYPDEFDVFTPSLKGRKDASLHDRKQKLEMNNSYDNTVLYTDYFLEQIIRRLKATDSLATLLYVADHGENLFDGECDKSGHGQTTERDFRVASVWWNSESYAKAWPDKAALVRERRDAPLATSHVFHTMLDAANIRYPQDDLARSVLNANWAARVRWTQAGLNFDAAQRDPVCKTLTTPPTY